MRAKVMFGVAGVLLLTLLMVFLLPRSNKLPADGNQNLDQPANTTVPESEPMAAAVEPHTTQAVPDRSKPEGQPAASAGAPVAGTQKIDVQARAEELMRLAMNNDSSSLD